jgi:hypothetical protein
LAQNGQTETDRHLSAFGAKRICRESRKRFGLTAESIEGIELRRAKASEMAGEEIDRLGDPLATDEERQLRKQRLIKGPQEFPDIRSNRAKIEPRFPE